MALTGITMFRARDGIADLDALIPDRSRLSQADFRLDDGSVALVYYTRTAAHPPRWAQFFVPVVDPNDLRTQSASAVIALERNGIYYLVTFGFGRYFIDLDLIEPSFGLRCTLNAVDPERIRSVDRKRVDSVSRLTREQLSRDSRMGQFGLNVFQDLLSAVTGVPTDPSLGKRIYGKDALGIQIDISKGQLGDLAEKLEDLYSQSTYQQNFPWIDRIGEVSGAKELDRLNRFLIRGLRRDTLVDIDLAPPEIVDWSRAYGYSYKNAIEPEPELSLAKYFEIMRDHRTIDIDQLKGDRIQLLDSDGGRLGGWSAFRCLSGEMVFDGRTYVISDGKWYRIAGDFFQEVDNAVQPLGKTAIALPDYIDTCEEKYNKRAAARSNGDLVCLDQQFIRPRSWHDRIEFCDLYSNDGKIIHVKRYSGSATLSHLFAQGAVSIRCFLTDVQFFQDLESKLPPTHQFGGKAPRPEACQVVYAIVGEKGKALKLPFFSRVALRNAAELIQNFGVNVTYQAIDNKS